MVILQVDSNFDKDKGENNAISIDDLVKQIDTDDTLSDIDAEDAPSKVNTYNKPVDTYTPAEAQRETYRLIDTVKQLELTVKNLTPTLTEGKRVLDAFEKMNLDKMEI
jgi:hypothetical protein